jgi:hypothetical protein
LNQCPKPNLNSQPSSSQISPPQPSPSPSHPISPNVKTTIKSHTITIANQPQSQAKCKQIRPSCIKPRSSPSPAPPQRLHPSTHLSLILHLLTSSSSLPPSRAKKTLPRCTRTVPNSTSFLHAGSSKAQLPLKQACLINGPLNAVMVGSVNSPGNVVVGIPLGGAHVLMLLAHNACCQTLSRVLQRRGSLIISRGPFLAGSASVLQTGKAINATALSVVIPHPPSSVRIVDT